MPCRDAISFDFMRMLVDRGWQRCLLSRYAQSDSGVLAFPFPIADLCGEVPAQLLLSPGQLLLLLLDDCHAAPHVSLCVRKKVRREPSSESTFQQACLIAKYEVQLHRALVSLLLCICHNSLLQWRPWQVRGGFMPPGEQKCSRKRVARRDSRAAVLLCQRLPSRRDQAPTRALLSRLPGTMIYSRITSAFWGCAWHGVSAFMPRAMSADRSEAVRPAACRSILRPL